MNIYILYYNSHDDYSSLPKDAKIIPIFKAVKGCPNIDHLKKRLAEIIDYADPSDAIVFNGPSYLCALAGYFWFSNEARSCANFYSYNLRIRAYEFHTESITDLHADQEAH